MGRVSRNKLGITFASLFIVAPRMGRVSRNVQRVHALICLLVAPRMGRVSRNFPFHPLLHSFTRSRPAWGV